MIKRNDLTGQKFGRLTVICFSHKEYRHRCYWKCICECGNKKIIDGHSLKTGSTKSCGCLKKEKSITHGKSRTSIYKIWHKMIRRCNNDKDKDYINYGGRGIFVSLEWKTFENFYRDMGDRPSDKTLDRIDNDKGYCKENCRWATKEEQENNKRNNKVFSFNGKIQPIKKWSEELNINKTTLLMRLNSGWDVQRAFTEKCEHRNTGIIQYDLNGAAIKKWKNLTEINKILGYSIGHISQVCNGKRNKAYESTWKYIK